jgi:hypothetical protein
MTMKFVGTFNNAQWAAFVQFVGAFIGGILISRGAAPDTVKSLIDHIVAAIPTIANFVAVAAPIVSLAWSLIRHTNRSTVIEASRVPGVKSIQIEATAPSPLISAATDTTVSKVNMAAPGAAPGA